MYVELEVDACKRACAGHVSAPGHREDLMVCLTSLVHTGLLSCVDHTGKRWSGSHDGSCCVYVAAYQRHVVNWASLQASFMQSSMQSFMGMERMGETLQTLRSSACTVQ
jgi:hypothetical protein